MYRRLLLSALLGLTLSACVPYYDGGQSYYRSEVYTSPAPCITTGVARRISTAVTTTPRRAITHHNRVITRPRVITSRRHATTGRVPVTGRTRTRAGAEGIGVMGEGTVAVPTMEVAAAVTVDGPVRQAAHEAPLFYGRSRQ